MTKAQKQSDNFKADLGTDREIILKMNRALNGFKLPRKESRVGSCEQYQKHSNLKKNADGYRRLRNKHL